MKFIKYLTLIAAVAVAMCSQNALNSMMSWDQKDALTAINNGDLTSLQSIVEADKTIVNKSITFLSDNFGAYMGTLLHYAYGLPKPFNQDFPTKKQPTIIEYLISQGADINALDSTGNKPGSYKVPPKFNIK